MARLAALVDCASRNPGLPRSFPGARRQSARNVGGAAAGIGLALLGTDVGAQSYPPLHVTALAQHADRASVAPNDIFRVTIHVKIAEQRQRLDELILGTFTDCEIISNETVRTAGPAGTDFVERLTVQALAPGDATITPAYIDAVDPAIGKPMRFSSNAIRVHVTGGAPLDRGLRAFTNTLGRLLTAAAIGVGLVAAVFVLGVMFLRRRTRRPAAARSAPAAQPVAAKAAPANTVPSGDRLTRAAAAYVAARSDSTLAEVRGVLFDAAGAPRGGTLLDALQILEERERALRVALLAAERAMFGPAAERHTAGDEMLAAIQAYTERAAANGDTWTR